MMIIIKDMLIKKIFVASAFVLSLFLTSFAIGETLIWIIRL